MGPGMFKGLDTLIIVALPLAILGLIAILAFAGWLATFLFHHIQFV